MIAAVIALAVALAALVGSFTYLMLRYDRVRTRVEELLEARAGHEIAVERANHATTQANAQLHETAREFADHRARAEAQLTAMREEIDALDDEIVRGGQPVPGRLADRMRRIRETAAVRDASGRGRASPASVPDGAAADPGGASGRGG